MPKGIPEPILDAIDRAESHAAWRLEKLNQSVNMDGARETILRILTSYITRRGTKYNPIFWEIATENVFMAVAIREAHKEPELSKDEIWAYVDHLAEFMNTLKHIQ
jgi:hypothetical protein